MQPLAIPSVGGMGVHQLSTFLRAKGLGKRTAVKLPKWTARQFNAVDLARLFAIGLPIVELGVLPEG